MPRTKKPQPESVTPTVPPPATLNGAPGEVLTLAEAAAYLRVSENQVIELVHFKGLPGRAFGQEWRFFKAAIQQWLSQPPPAKPDFWETWIGAFKDDPHLKEIVK